MLKRWNLRLIVAFAGAAGLSLPVRAETEDEGQVRRERFEVGLRVQFMPIGWFDLADTSHRADFRAYPAFGVAVFGDYRLNPYLSFGVSPEITLNVFPNRADSEVGDRLVLDGRVQLRYPSRLFEPYVVVAGGYSRIFRSYKGTAQGPVVAAVLGGRGRLGRGHALIAELGYQKGFEFDSAGDYSPAYLVTGLGWQVGW